MTITVRTLRWSQALQCLLRSPPPPLVALEPVMQWRNIWVVSRRLNCRHWCHTGTWLGELLGQFSQPCPWGKQPGELLGWEKAFGATDIVAEQVGAVPGGLLDTSMACGLRRQEDFQVEMRRLVSLSS